MDNTPGLLCACAPNEALDASLHSFVVSKAYASSVTKQPNSKCFREAPVASFHLTCCSFAMTTLVHFECMASSRGNSTLHTFNTAPSSTTASWVSWHGLYKPLDLREGEKRVQFQSLILCYNTLDSNICVRICGMMFYDSISWINCKMFNRL